MTSGSGKLLSSRALESIGQRARIAAASARLRARNHIFIPIEIDRAADLTGEE
jgi:hypothetical protein